jgi:hypothetical protein
MLSLALLPKSVCGEARAKRPFPRADSSIAGASRHCVPPLCSFFNAPPLMPTPHQTYVLAALYELQDTISGEQAGQYKMNGRESSERVQAEKPAEDLRIF